MSFVTSNPGASPIVVEATFPVSRSKVFSAWTEPEHIMNWFGATPGSVQDARIDLRPGGSWRFVEAAGSHGVVGFEGVYAEVVSNRRLVFSWAKITESPDGSRTSTAQSRVEITLTDADGGTNMRIVHSHVDPSVGGFAGGWERGTANLIAYLDVG